MQNAETILQIIQERGRRGLPLERVYRLLFNPELYSLAYARISHNKGAVTPGLTEQTADGMSLETIWRIIEDVRHERYRWTPVKAPSVSSGNGERLRQGIPTWSDKLLQEVIRCILEAYYEPRFSDRAHGYRPHRGCHTALAKIQKTWLGTVWFIRGDLSRCFDRIDHGTLLSILGQQIHDNRFLRLLENLLRAGYLEEWRCDATYSGTPQGSIVSPLLTNIYLDRLDQYVEQTLSPLYNRGARRKANPEYTGLLSQVRTLRRMGEEDQARAVRKEAQQIPSVLTNDAGFRRSKYVRYAGDFLIGFTGPRKEAEAIRQEIQQFLREELKLEIPEQKIAILHARTEATRFLGYDIHVVQEDTREERRRHRRIINGRIGLRVPREVLKAKSQTYLREGKAHHRAELLQNTEFSIVAQYQSEYRGFVQYYRLAHNLSRLGELKWIMEQSLTMTLAAKLKISVAKVYDRFGATLKTEHGVYKGLQVIVERADRKPLVATWGGVPLRRQTNAVLHDQIPRPVSGERSEILERLLAGECELCGSRESVQVHHVRAMKDLQKRGRKESPDWVKVMAARRRKTLAVCKECHHRIHDGCYDGLSLKE